MRFSACASNSPRCPPTSSWRSRSSSRQRPWRSAMRTTPTCRTPCATRSRCGTRAATAASTTASSATRRRRSTPASARVRTGRAAKTRPSPAPPTPIASGRACRRAIPRSVPAATELGGARVRGRRLGGRRATARAPSADTRFRQRRARHDRRAGLPARERGRRPVADRKRQGLVRVHRRARLGARGAGRRSRYGDRSPRHGAAQWTGDQDGHRVHERPRGTDLAASPTPLYLGRVRQGTAARREITVVPGRPGTTARVTWVENTNPALHAVLEPLPGGGGQRVVVTLDPHLPLGRLNDQLVLHTTSARTPDLTVPVFGSVEGDVVVLPPQITFGVTHRGDTPERQVHIRNRGVRPLRITGVSAPSDVVRYQLDTVEDGREYLLTLTLRDGLPAGTVERTVDIFTDHPDEGHLAVPLYAIVRDGKPRG